MGVGRVGVAGGLVGSWVGTAFRGVIRNGGVAWRGNGVVLGEKCVIGRSSKG